MAWPPPSPSRARHDAAKDSPPAGAPRGWPSVLWLCLLGGGGRRCGGCFFWGSAFGGLLWAGSARGCDGVVFGVTSGRCLRPVTVGLWPLACGRWPVAVGLWPLACGGWPVAVGLFFGVRLGVLCGLRPGGTARGSRGLVRCGFRLPVGLAPPGCGVGGLAVAAGRGGGPPPLPRRGAARVWGAGPATRWVRHRRDAALGGSPLRRGEGGGPPRLGEGGGPPPLFPVVVRLGFGVRVRPPRGLGTAGMRRWGARHCGGKKGRAVPSV